jgi:phosphoribosylamine--glycine ligase
MMRLKSDLVELCQAALNKTLDQISTEWDERPALGVVLAAGGYPDDYAKGHVISGLPDSESADSKVFHAGTQQQGAHVVTAGGRVLCACALGQSIADAQTKAYQLCKQIDWQDMYYRTDIGFKAIS